MSRAKDRHEIGDLISEWLLQENDAGHLLGLAIGSPCNLAALADRGAERQDDGRFHWDVPDPDGQSRELIARVQAQQGQTKQVEISFFSEHRLDVDAVYRKVRRKLRKAWRDPSKELKGVLTFWYDHKGKGKTGIRRFTNSEGRHLMQLVVTS